jgi:hypothetical protein
MARQKLTANGELDLLTRDEMQGVLKSWANELTRGARMISHTMQGTSGAGGALTIGDNHDGPEPGVMWAINRLSVALGTGVTLGAGGLQVYKNVVETSTLLVRSLVTDVFPGDKGVVITGGDTLRIDGIGVTASSQVTITMSIKEVPALMAWSL